LVPATKSRPVPISPPGHGPCNRPSSRQRRRSPSRTKTPRNISAGFTAFGGFP